MNEFYTEFADALRVLERIQKREKERAKELEREVIEKDEALRTVAQLDMGGENRVLYNYGHVLYEISRDADGHQVRVIDPVYAHNAKRLAPEALEEPADCDTCGAIIPAVPDATCYHCTTQAVR